IAVTCTWSVGRYQARAIFSVSAGTRRGSSPTTNRLSSCKAPSTGSVLNPSVASPSPRSPSSVSMTTKSQFFHGFPTRTVRRSVIFTRRGSCSRRRAEGRGREELSNVREDGVQLAMVVGVQCEEPGPANGRALEDSPAPENLLVDDGPVQPLQVQERQQAVEDPAGLRLVSGLQGRPERHVDVGHLAGRHR